MKIGIDFDDTISQSMEAIVNFHNDTYGTNLNIEDVTTYNLWEVWGGTIEEAVKKVHEFHKSSYARDAKPINDSQRIIEELKKNNELYIITARTDDIRKESEEWLEKYFPKTFKEIYFTNHFSNDLTKKTTKKKFCDELNIDIFIEDSLRNALECVGPNRKVFLLDYPWNQTDNLPPNVSRVKNWKEIEKSV